MKVINAKIHGIIDYLVVVFLLAAPSLFGLPPTTALFTYVLGGIHLALTLLTDTDLGLIKVIPFPIHGWIELIVGIALVGAAFYLGGLEGDLARNFYLGFGGAVLLVWALTDYQS
ncbi:hypothetical protein [Persicitalea sp.]|uniref:hypothetical protein n=1 Tax=Persicitalea sp. TaxID=3100273 RepID=UPI0035941F5A